MPFYKGFTNIMRMNEFEAISNLQTYLRQLSYFDDDIPTVPIDGIYESETENAVNEFQKKYGLEQTGVADKETWNMIYEAYLDSIRENSPPELISPFPRTPNNYSLQYGDKWFLVEIVQYILGELSHGYDNFGALERTGIFDDATREAVREFQRKNLLRDTGKVDKETWNALSNQFNNVAKNKNE